MNSKILTYVIWVTVVPYATYQAMVFIARNLPGIPYAIATNLLILYMVGLATVLLMPGRRITRLMVLLVMPVLYYFVIGVYEPDTGRLGTYALLAAGVALVAGGVSALAVFKYQSGKNK